MVVIVCILFAIAAYLAVRLLVFSKTIDDINLIFCVRIECVDAAEQGKISFAQCDKILDEIEYEKLQKPSWEVFLNPLIWTRKSRFKKGMLDVLIEHYRNLQSL